METPAKYEFIKTPTPPTTRQAEAARLALVLVRQAVEVLDEAEALDNPRPRGTSAFTADVRALVARAGDTLECSLNGLDA